MDHDELDQAGRLARVEVKVDLLEGETERMHADVRAVKDLLSQLKGAMRMLIGILWVISIMLAGSLGAGKWEHLFAWLGK